MSSLFGLFAIIIGLAAFSTSLPSFSGEADTPITLAPGQDALTVPLGGNTWKSGSGKKGGEISDEGIRNWTDEKHSFTTYVRIARPGTCKVWLRLKVPGGKSRIAVGVKGRFRKMTVSGADPADVYAGEWMLPDTGYVAFEIKGISKTGKVFADVAALKLEGTAIGARTRFVENDEGNFFYWGRRGPSVHLTYQMPEHVHAEWFYNEITVPRGEDVIGSYFMANGFGEGYFGIQVNSASERRVLFSVWSPFNTNDPDEIPDDQKIIMLKKGPDVYTGEFGNEGSGGQSYLRYDWKAGNTYKFLLHGRPDGRGSTVYTAYFYPPELGEWKLIASFKRPRTDTWLTRFHSFLENFIPSMGNQERHVFFGDQWIRDNKGNWIELNKARFTADNTARKEYRMDYAGGSEDGRFYLKNCGFFAGYTQIGSEFERSAGREEPAVDISRLP